MTNYSEMTVLDDIADKQLKMLDDFRKFRSEIQYTLNQIQAKQEADSAKFEDLCRMMRESNAVYTSENDEQHEACYVLDKMIDQAPTGLPSFSHPYVNEDEAYSLALEALIWLFEEDEQSPPLFDESPATHLLEKTEEKVEGYSMGTTLHERELLGNEMRQPHLLRMRSIKDDHQMFDKLPEQTSAEQNNEKCDLNISHLILVPRLDFELWLGEISRIIFDPGGYTKESSSLVVIGMNFHTTPLEVREKIYILEAQWPQAISELCELNHIDEAAVLSTCNRMEVYVVALSKNSGVKEVTELMYKIRGVPTSELCQHRVLLYNKDATQHLFEVSAGLDSLVLGGGQILAQVRQVVNTGQGVSGYGRKINGLFKHAITAGKCVRTETNIATGSVSVSSAAVELAQIKLPDCTYANARVLVVGAGKLVVVNRTKDKVAAIDDKLKNVAISYRPLSEMLACVAEVDVVFTCIASHTPLFLKEHVQALPPIDNPAKRGTRLFIDISVPRNVGSCVSNLDNACVYNVDDLKEVVAANKEDRMLREDPADFIPELESFVWDPGQCTIFVTSLRTRMF